MLWTKGHRERLFLICFGFSPVSTIPLQQASYTYVIHKSQATYNHTTSFESSLPFILLVLLLRSKYSSSTLFSDSFTSSFVFELTLKHAVSLYGVSKTENLGRYYRCFGNLYHVIRYKSAAGKVKCNWGKYVSGDELYHLQ